MASSERRLRTWMAELYDSGGAILLAGVGIPLPELDVFHALFTPCGEIPSRSQKLPVHLDIA
jgi:hypothetical protein